MSKTEGFLRAGVIGAGWVASARHLPSLLKDRRVQVMAVYDPDIHRAEAMAQRFDVPIATSDINRMLALATDFVSICTPPTTHYALTMQALAAGRHVLVEKPMAMSTGEARLMAEMAARQNLRLCVCHNLLYARSVTRALQLLEDAGPLQHVIAVQLSNPQRRLPTWYHDLPGGLFFDESPHMTYLLRRILGDFAVDQVWMRPAPGQGSQSIDFLEARLSNGDASANLTMGFSAPVSEWDLTIICERRIIALNLFRDIVTAMDCDGRHGPTEVLRSSMGVALQSASGFVSSGALYALNRLLYGHDLLIRAFIDSIEGGPAAVEPAAAVAVVRTMEEILRLSGIETRVGREKAIA